MEFRIKATTPSWLEQKETRLAQEEKAESQRQKTLARELEWIRMSPKARQSKGKARVTSYELLLGQEAEARREELDIYIPPGPRLGDVVFEFDKVTKSYASPEKGATASFSTPFLLPFNQAPSSGSLVRTAQVKRRCSE